MRYRGVISCTASVRTRLCFFHFDIGRGVPAFRRSDTLYLDYVTVNQIDGCSCKKKYGLR